jgi:hypothetical protein
MQQRCQNMASLTCKTSSSCISGTSHSSIPSLLQFMALHDQRVNTAIRLQLPSICRQVSVRIVAINIVATQDVDRPTLASPSSTTSGPGIELVLQQNNLQLNADTSSSILFHSRRLLNRRFVVIAKASAKRARHFYRVLRAGNAETI